MFLRRLAPVILALTLFGGCTSAATGPAEPAASASSQAKVNLDAAEFAALVAEPGVIVLDVRSPAEFASGHLANAQNIDVQAADFDARVAALPKDGNFAVYCRSGNRSATALKKMKAAGITRAAHLSGGIGAWQAAGYQVVS